MTTNIGLNSQNCHSCHSFSVTFTHSNSQFRHCLTNSTLVSERRNALLLYFMAKCKTIRGGKVSKMAPRRKGRKSSTVPVVKNNHGGTTADGVPTIDHQEKIVEGEDPVNSDIGDDDDFSDLPLNDAKYQNLIVCPKSNDAVMTAGNLTDSPSQERISTPQAITAPTKLDRDPFSNAKPPNSKSMTPATRERKYKRTPVPGGHKIILLQPGDLPTIPKN